MLFLKTITAIKQKNGTLQENQEIAAAAAPPEKGWNYAPGKSAFDALANNEKSKTQWLGFIQQKLIKYPPAIAIVLGKKLNKWFSHGTLTDFVQASQKSLKKSNYFLGFPENTAKLEAVLGKENLPLENLKGAFVFLNNNNVRHIMNRHGNDKNPITPADFELLLAGLSNGVVELSGGESKKRLKVRFQHKKTKMESIWDFEPDLKTINLVTFYKLN